MPADKGSSEVGDGRSVEGAREGGARDALPGGTAEPGLLGVVDLEVGGDGAVETLFGEDGDFVGRSEAFGLDGSGFLVKGGGVLVEVSWVGSRWLVLGVGWWWVVGGVLVVLMPHAGWWCWSLVVDMMCMGDGCFGGWACIPSGISVALLVVSCAGC